MPSDHELKDETCLGCRELNVDIFYTENSDYKIVHTHGYFADICGLPAARLLGISTVSTCHGYISSDSKIIIYNKIDKYALRLSHLVIAVSGSIKTHTCSQRLKKLKIAVLPNAVNSNYFKNQIVERRRKKRSSQNISDDEFLVGSIGRLSIEKGVLYLIEAIEDLRNAKVKVKLLIVGDGPERKTLERLVKDKKLEALIIFAGFQFDIEQWIPAFDVFVLPSLTEGTPMALLEVMASGVPVIASAVGGVPKVISDRVNGLLVNPGETDEIRDRIILLKENSVLRHKLAMKGVDTIKSEYNIANWCKSIECFYQKII